MTGLYGDGLYGDGLYGLARVLKLVFANPVQHLNAIFANAQHLNALFANPVQHLNITLSEVAMTTPNTTIDSSATVTDQHGALVANIPTATLAVTFPDHTTATPNVTNEGSGVYTATYNTKGAGMLTELWIFTDVSGAVAQEQRILIISY